jgi:LacI family transcriptional regulator
VRDLLLVPADGTLARAVSRNLSRRFVRTAEYLTAVQALYAPFGVIAPSTRVNFERLRQFGFGDRVVVIDRVAEGSEVPSVTVDSRRGIELAFEHLRGLGHSS